MNTLHFISNNGFFFLFCFLFCGKEATTTTKQTWKGKTISVDFFLICKYKMDKNIYVKKKLYNFTYPRSAQCINICREKYS